MKKCIQLKSQYVAGVAGLYDNRTIFKELQLLSRAVMHMTKWNNSVFANRLVTLVRNALN